MCILQFQHQIFIILWEMNVSIYNCGYQHCEHSPCIFCVFKFLKVTLNKNKTRFIVKYWMSKLAWLVFLSVFPSLAQRLWASSRSWCGCSLPLPWPEQGSTCLPSQAEVQIKKKKKKWRHFEYLHVWAQKNQSNLSTLICQKEVFKSMVPFHCIIVENPTKCNRFVSPLFLQEGERCCSRGGGFSFFMFCCCFYAQSKGLGHIQRLRQGKDRLCLSWPEHQKHPSG